LADGNHLTRDEQLCVIQWLVELKSYQDIVELIEDKFNKHITKQAIYKYAHAKKWKPIIKRLRKNFETNLLKIPIANKANRLKALQKVLEEGFKWNLKSQTTLGKNIFELNLGAVTKAIKEAREELEPDKGTGGLNVSNVIINIVRPATSHKDSDRRLHSDRTSMADSS